MPANEEQFSLTTSLITSQIRRPLEGEGRERKEKRRSWQEICNNKSCLETVYVIQTFLFGKCSFTKAPQLIMQFSVEVAK